MVETVNLRTNKPILFFDIETGGLWSTIGESIVAQKREWGIEKPEPRVSSILSISYKVGDKSSTFYSKPVVNSWVSQFSQENILPQLQGKITNTEEDTIRQFIQVLRQNPDAYITGYNILGFDLRFLQNRAAQYELRDQLVQALRGRIIIDTGFLVRDQIMSAIVEHIWKGTFKEELGGKTFDQLELEYFGPKGRQYNRRTPIVPYQEQNKAFKVLSQAEAFVRGGYKGRVQGWKLAPIFAQYAEWANLPAEQKSLASAAHESLADVKMTEILYEAVNSGKFQQFVEREEFAKSWLQEMLESRAVSAAKDVTAGEYYRPTPNLKERITPRKVADTAQDFLSQAARRIERNPALLLPDQPLPKGAGKWAVVLAVSAAALLTGAGYLAFSGSDDEYNVIEGLRHDGIASDYRRSMTEFGSGWLGYGAPIAAGITAAMLSGDMSLGVSMYAGASSGASLGYLVGGTKGSIAGVIAGASTLGLADYAAEQWIGGAGGGLVAGIALSIGSSIGSIGKMKGGLLYPVQKKIAQKIASIFGIEKDDLGDFLKLQYGHNPLTDPAGFSQTASRALLSQINLARRYTDPSNHTLIKGLDKLLHGAEKVISNPRVSSVLDATFGSPRLEKLARQHGAIDKVPTKELAKTIGIDILEGMPLGIGAAMAATLLAGTNRQLAEIEPRQRRESKALDIRKLSQKQLYMLETSLAPFSGWDDNYNVIEGLGHGGQAQQMRKKFTPFGSGWDALRNLTKVGEKFEDMLKSSEFQRALSEARYVREIGEGQFGAVNEMKGIFRGQEFSFVRKIGYIGDYEVESLRKFQDRFAPTFYGQGSMDDVGLKFIDMEKFEGMDIGQLEEAGLLDRFDPTELRRVLDELKESRWVHGDLHGGNIMVTNEGKLGLIDFGASGPVGSSAELTWRGEIVRLSGMKVRTYSRDEEMAAELIKEISSAKSVHKPAIAAAISSSSTLLERPVKSNKTPLERPIKLNKTKIDRKKVKRAEINRVATKTLFEGVRGGKKSRL